MRTVGDILKKARIEQKLSLDDAEKKLRIRKKYLTALEENAWQDLPSLPYIKGFLRNYSIYLGLKPEEMLAFFRRQFRDPDEEDIVPETSAHPVDDRSFHWTPKLSLLLGIFICVGLFVGYVVFQYRSVSRPPSLTVTQPPEGAVIISQDTTVAGTSDPDAVVSVNNQKVALAADGSFQTSILLTPGVNTIVIEAVNTFGKKLSITRTIQANY